MSTRKIVIYVVMAICLLLLIKIFSDQTHRESLSEADVPPVPRELPTPTFPVSYSIGTFDQRFAISRERFLTLAAEAKKVWEDAAGRSLFEPAEDGSMKINLIYDWRQEKLLQTKEVKARLDEKGRSFDQLQADYNEKARVVDFYRSSYEDAAQTAKTHLDEYNQRVARWNEGKDHSDAEYTYLQTRKKEIEDEQGALEKKRVDLNSRTEELNTSGQTLKELADKHNVDVQNYNGVIVSSRDFEKGLFDGKAINIYEFEKEEDLKLALVHEFGHAIGLGHVDNPKSIMCPKLAAQDINNIRLSPDDLNLLRTKVR